MKDIKKRVSELRLSVPYFKNNRRVVVTDITTKKGKGLVCSAAYNLGYSLDDIYTTYSTAKAEAFNEVWEMYCNDYDAIDFHITSKNCQGFCVAWFTNNVLVYITPKTEYLVVLAG